MKRHKEISPESMQKVLSENEKQQESRNSPRPRIDSRPYNILISTRKQQIEIIGKPQTEEIARRNHTRRGTTCACAGQFFDQRCCCLGARFVLQAAAETSAPILRALGALASDVTATRCWMKMVTGIYPTPSYLHRIGRAAVDTCPHCST